MNPTDPHKETIELQLSDAQVATVVHATATASGTRPLLAGLHGPLRHEDPAGGSQLSQSLVKGLSLFAALPTDGSYMGVGELARLVGLGTSTTHRYISTLLAVGLLARDEKTRRYRPTQSPRASEVSR